MWPYRLLNRGLYPLAMKHCPLVEKDCPLKREDSQAVLSSFSHKSTTYWTIAILWITFCQEGPVSFFSCTINKVIKAKKILVRHVTMALFGKNGSGLVIAPPADHFGVWVTGAILYHPFGFHWHRCYGVGTVPNINWDYHQCATPNGWSVTPSSVSSGGHWQ